MKIHIKKKKSILLIILLVLSHSNFIFTGKLYLLSFLSIIISSVIFATAWYSKIIMIYTTYFSDI